MKTNRHLIFLVIVFSFGVFNSFAQESLSASGNDLASSDGFFSYSVGQLVYETISGAGGSITQGVEQPYEVSEVLSSVDFLDITEGLTVSPNPSTDLLVLSMRSFSNLEFNYLIIDMNGKVVKKGAIDSDETSIPVEYLPSSTYFLKVINQEKAVKVFKIIKN